MWPWNMYSELATLTNTTTVGKHDIFSSCHFQSTASFLILIYNALRDWYDLKLSWPAKVLQKYCIWQIRQKEKFFSWKEKMKYECAFNDWIIFSITRNPLAKAQAFFRYYCVLLPYLVGWGPKSMHHLFSARDTNTQLVLTVIF